MNTQREIEKEAEKQKETTYINVRKSVCGIEIEN